MSTAPANRISDVDLRDDMNNVARQLGRAPSITEYKSLGRFSWTTFVNRFGSFNTAKSSLLNVAIKSYRTPSEDILNDLRRVKSIVGHIPSLSEYHLHGQFTKGMISPRFGSWNAGLNAAFGETFQDSQRPVSVICEECSSICTKLPCQIRQNKHQFCSLSCSSIYMQKHKTNGVNKSKMELFIRQKLEEEFPNLRILFNDRTTFKLELDILIPSLNLAFEINGIFHYKPIFGLAKLAKTQMFDHMKRDACDAAGVILHVVNTSEVFTQSQKEMVLELVMTTIKSALPDS